MCGRGDSAGSVGRHHRDHQADVRPQLRQLHHQCFSEVSVAVCPSVCTLLCVCVRNFFYCQAYSLAMSFHELSLLLCYIIYIILYILLFQLFYDQIYLFVIPLFQDSSLLCDLYLLR